MRKSLLESENQRGNRSTARRNQSSTVSVSKKVQIGDILLGKKKSQTSRKPPQPDCIDGLKQSITEPHEGREVST